MKKITIVGGGASGTLLAVNLLKNANSEPLEINLVEKSAKFGRGVAYSTSDEVHLLNVPAAKMGAFPDDIEHFHKWLTAKDYDYAPGDFVSRKIYGNYLNEVFDEAVSNKNENSALNLINDEAIDVLTENDSAFVLLKSGEKIASDKVVLAFGNFLPPNLPTESNEYLSADKYFQNAWDNEIPNKIAPTDDILMIGMGLTAVDNILSFYHKKHQGKIIAVSNHGWFPTVHAAAQPYQSFTDEIETKNDVRSIFKIVRKHCESAKNWRAVIDSLRPVTQKTWFRLPASEKRIFMRHLRRLWDVSRHRMPPQCAAILEEMQANGQLLVRAGKIKDIQELGGKLTVFYNKNEAESNIAADVIINCIGSESNFAKIKVPLIQNLLEKGEIKPDALKLGLDAMFDGTIIDRENKPSNVFVALGTALKGILWESTAMPEIRAQANELALKLLSADSKVKQAY